MCEDKEDTEELKEDESLSKEARMRKSWQRAEFLKAFGHILLQATVLAQKKTHQKTPPSLSSLRTGNA